jgi:hypothetical protein
VQLPGWTCTNDNALCKNARLIDCTGVVPVLQTTLCATTHGLYSIAISGAIFNGPSVSAVYSTNQNYTPRCTNKLSLVAKPPTQFGITNGTTVIEVDTGAAVLDLVTVVYSNGLGNSNRCVSCNR